MTTKEKIDFMRLMINDRERKLTSLELDIRFAKRQLLMFKGDESIKMQQTVNQFEAMRKGESEYLQFLKEVIAEEIKRAAKEAGNGHSSS